MRNKISLKSQAKKRSFRFLYWLVAMLPVAFVALLTIGELKSRWTFEQFNEEVTQKGGEVTLVFEGDRREDSWHDIFLPMMGRDKRMEEIIYLNMSGTDIDDIWMKKVTLMKNLKTIFICHTAISDTGVSCLSELQHLTAVELIDTSVSDESLQYLKNADKLQYLWLGNTQITGEGLTHLPNKNYILGIGFSECKQLEARWLAQLKDFTSLKQLHLSESNINDSHIESLKDLPTEMNLDLSLTNITDKSIPYLVKMNPRNLYISGTKITSQGTEQLRKLLPDCNILGSPNDN